MLNDAHFFGDYFSKFSIGMSDCLLFVPPGSNLLGRTDVAKRGVGGIAN